MCGDYVPDTPHVVEVDWEGLGGVVGVRFVAGLDELEPELAVPTAAVQGFTTQAREEGAGLVVGQGVEALADLGGVEAVKRVNQVAYLALSNMPSRSPSVCEHPIGVRVLAHLATSHAGTRDTMAPHTPVNSLSSTDP